MNDYDSISRLTLAAATGNVIMLRMWLAHGANPQAFDSNHPTPLLTALKNDHFACVELLIPHSDLNEFTDLHGMDFDAVERLHTRQPFAALHMAAFMGDLDYIDMLLSAGADPNLQNLWGTTPLMVAAQSAQLESCRRLIDGGANPHLSDLQNHDAFSHAHHGAHPTLPEFIASYSLARSEQRSLQSSTFEPASAGKTCRI